MLKIKTPLTLVTILSLSTSCGNNPQSANNLNSENASPKVTQLAAIPKIDCGLDEGLTIAERIKDCGNETKNLSTGQTIKLVARRTGQDEVKSEEYFQDSETELVWETSVSEIAFSREQAQLFCKDKQDLGLSWRLPNVNDFLKLGNKSNSQDHNLIVSEVFPSLYTRGSANFWTTSQVPYLVFFSKSLLFKNIQAQQASGEDYNIKTSVNFVQCVATESK